MSARVSVTHLTRASSFLTRLRPSEAPSTRYNASATQRRDAAEPSRRKRDACHRSTHTVSSQGGVKRHRSPSRGAIFSSRNTAFPTDAAATPERNPKTPLACAPTADVCCRVWLTTPGTRDSRAVGSDRLKTPASAARQTPRRGVDSHGQNCVRSGTPGFSACCTSHCLYASGLDHPA